MFLWQTVRGRDGRVETVEGWPTLADAIAEMAASSWEDPGPGNPWASYVVEQATGEIVAVALFGPDRTLLLTVSDGTRREFPMPECYRQHGLGGMVSLQESMSVPPAGPPCPEPGAPMEASGRG